MTNGRFRLLLIVGMLWVLGLSIIYPIMSGERAFARPLNVCPNGHCYGTVTWDNGILGAITWFNTVNCTASMTVLITSLKSYGLSTRIQKIPATLIASLKAAHGWR